MPSPAVDGAMKPADTQQFDVAVFLEAEEALWPAPRFEPLARDPDLALVEEAWRTGKLRVPAGR